MMQLAEIARLVEYNRQHAIALDDLRMKPLFTAMGCSTIERFAHEWVYKKATATSGGDEALIADTLINLLDQIGSHEMPWSQSHYSLLEGLSRHNRWQACLKDRKQTYALALIALHYSHCGAHSPSELTRGMSEDVHHMLTQWLKPKTPWLRMPALEETARAMFGDAWWDLVAGDDTDTKIFAKVLNMTTTTQPDFLPWALSGLPECSALDLPLMDA